MAWELLTEVPQLLKEGYVMHFTDQWKKEWEDKWFKVQIAQQIRYDVSRTLLIGTSDYLDVSFQEPGTGTVSNDKISLRPYSPHTVYEILLGIEGLCRVYPMYNNDYFQKLEENGVVPKLTDASLAHMGFFTSEISPYWAPKLREYTVKDQEPPVLRLWNPWTVEEKCILHFTVNRCKVLEVNPQTLSEIDKRAAREVKYFTKFTW